MFSPRAGPNQGAGSDEAGYGDRLNVLDIKAPMGGMLSLGQLQRLLVQA